MRKKILEKRRMAELGEKLCYKTPDLIIDPEDASINVAEEVKKLFS